MQVKYIGRKGRIPVDLPIGCKHKGAVYKTLWAEPFVELSSEDALALVALDPRNFELRKTPEVKPEVKFGKKKNGNDVN